MKKLIAIAALALLAACSSTGEHRFDIQTAATGTAVEAKQVVALVYAGGSDAEIGKLLYSGGDLTRAVQRLRERQPRLRASLDEGAIGNTAGGFVALRDEKRREELRSLLWDENRDRALLYEQVAIAVGYGGLNYVLWRPYTSFSFGKEWIGQGPAGWWSLDEQGQWSRR